MSDTARLGDTVRVDGAAGSRREPAARPRGIRGNTLWFWIFVGPFLIGLLIFSVIPVVWSIVLSFFESQGTVAPTNFVGLGNYVAVLQDEAFTSSLLTFTIFAVFIVPLTFALSLGLALLVNQVKFARAFFRSVYFLPTACSYVLGCLIWKLSIFNGVRFGLANTLLGLFDFEPIAWLSTLDPPWYWIPLITVRLWLQLGFYMILFIAGLQQIPAELYEAAYVDGAKPGWQVFRYITLPQLRTTAIAVLLLNLIAAYQAFEEFYNMAQAIPDARPPLLYIYQTALGGQQLGLGSAGSVIVGLLILVLTLVQARIFGFGRSSSD